VRLMKHLGDTSLRQHNPEVDELYFMSKYIWRTLLALYDRLNIRGRLSFRNIDGFIEFDERFADAVKSCIIVADLIDMIKKILVRMHRILIEELAIGKHYIRGRIQVSLAAKYFPLSVPTRVSKLTSETPENLLLVITILETRELLFRALSILNACSSFRSNVLYEALLSTLKEELSSALSRCEYILSDPALRPLILKARLIIDSKEKVSRLEEEVRLNVIRKPKELGVYADILDYREKLRAALVILIKEVEGLGRRLAIKIGGNKIYELYGFTLILETICSIFEIDRGWRVNIVSEGKVLQLKGPEVEILISYNALIEDVESRLKYSKAYGILDCEIEEVKKLGGLPDTIIKIVDSRGCRVIVVDYKYTRSMDYIVNARFKVFSYLYEFKGVNAGIVVSPIPQKGEISDEEAYEQESFYMAASKHYGAVINIDSNGKILALAFLEPKEELLDKSRIVLKRLFGTIINI